MASGFAAHPENINRKGRPKKEHSITHQLRALSEEIDEESGKTKAQLLAEKLWALALEEGDKQVMVHIIDRLDGKPKESLEVEQVQVQPLVIKKSGEGHDE